MESQIKEGDTLKQEQELDREISFGMMLRFALPTILSSVFMSVYTTVDGIFVSHLIDTNALSAVTVVNADHYGDFCDRHDVRQRRKCVNCP